MSFLLIASITRNIGKKIRYGLVYKAKLENKQIKKMLSLKFLKFLIS